MSPIEKELLFKTVLKQRAALYQLHQEHGVTRTDLEVLSFSLVKRFFTFHDLQTFYPHTNVQVIKRSLRKLNMTNHLEILRKGLGNRPTFYCLSIQGKRALERYSVLILGSVPNEINVTTNFGSII